jgi:pimeloyl-ACP methyl ester carboxylesterase
MEKVAVMINGLAAPIKEDYFLVKWLAENGYKIIMVEPLLGETGEDLNGEPEVIFCWSMGGLIAPKLALKYPKSRLVMMATGPRLNPKEVSVKLLYRIVGLDWSLKVINASLKLPKKILVDGYEWMNKVPDLSVRELYRKQMADNIELFRNLSQKQINDLVKFLKTTDTTNLLKQVKNKTLIFCGKKDKLMPVDDSLELHELISGSKLVITEGGHYNVVSESDLPIIEKFLE